MLAPRIALIGLPGAGKSAVAPLLAARLGFASVDLDEAIERDAGRPVAALIRERGEAEFRDLEARALAAALAPAPGERGRVIACGGGVLEREENRARLKRGTFVVWMLVEPEEAARRLGSSSGDRPLLAAGPGDAGPALGERIEALLVKRREAYAGAASARIATGGRTAAQVAAEIETLWARAGSSGPGAARA